MAAVPYVTGALKKSSHDDDDDDITEQRHMRQLNYSSSITIYPVM